MDKLNFKGPIVLAIMDGVGLSEKQEGNAFARAYTPFLDSALKNYLNIPLEASGESVGILSGDMGNSEVGHNAIGSGQIIKQGIARVEEAFDTGAIWQNPNWEKIISNVKDNSSTLHFAGIFSDGNVHSSISHLERMIKRANEEGIKKIRVHLMIDGRDVPPQSEPKYINRLEDFFKTFDESCDYKIASGGGRMVVVCDRYENDWNMVKKGWDMMVHGEAPDKFRSAIEALEFFREKDPSIQDQYLPPFVITDESNNPVGPVKDGDSFIYYDFRADRAIEIAMAFTYNDFPYFDRGDRPNVCFAGMTEYNSDTHVPALTLVSPVCIENALNQYLDSKGISQFAVSEAVKFGHITYYFNGNSYEKAPGEEHLSIPSDQDDFHIRPWMKSAEITDAVLANLENHKFVRLNLPNGDMVGHFADMRSTIIAMESVDLALSRIAKKVDELGGMMIICADHGNAEEIADENGKPKTSHTLNKVPCIFYDNTENRTKYVSAELPNPGLTNIASTVALLCGESGYPANWCNPLIKVI